MIERFARLPIDNPKQITVSVIIFSLLISPYIFQVEFATDVQAFLPQSEEVDTYEKINNRFGKDSSVLNLYLTSVSKGNVLSIQNIEDILELHYSCSSIFGVDSVLSVSGLFDSALRDSGLSLDQVQNSDAPWQLIYDSMYNVESGNFSLAELEFVTDVLINKDLNLKPFLLYDSIGLEQRSAPISNSTIIMVTLDSELSTEEKKAVGQKIRTLADSHNYESGSDIKAEPFSIDLLAHDVDESTKYTNIMMGLGMLAVTTALLWLTFRHWSYVFLPLITLVLSVFWTFSFAGFLNIKLTAIDVAVIPLVVGLGIDFAVHISRRYQEGLSSGKSVKDSLLEAQLHTGQALTLAMITTVIAFLSGIGAGVGPVRDFSFLCALGIFSSFILTVFFYTSLRYLLDSNSESVFYKSPSAQVFIDKSISRASEIVDKRPQAVISVVAVFTLLALGGASQISTSFSLDDFLSDELDIMITADNIQSNFRGASYSQSQILIEGQVATPEFLDGQYEMQNGNYSSNTRGLNDDRYIVKVGAAARVESVYALIQRAIDSEDYNKDFNNNSTHEWIITNHFLVNSNESLLIEWDTRPSIIATSLETTVFWYNLKGEQIGNNDYIYAINPSVTTHSEVIVTSPPDSHTSRVKFSHLKDNRPDETLVRDVTAKESNIFVYVLSLESAFNITDTSRPVSNSLGEYITTNQDVQNLYDYLYQRDLDVADPFTGRTYSDQIHHVLYRDVDGVYSSAVFRVYFGAKPDQDLDNEGLEFMRNELSEDIPVIFKENYVVSMSGGYILTSVTVEAIQSTQVSSTLLSILLAGIVLIFIYKNIGIGFLATLPTILATVWIMATMALLGITLNVLTVMVTALTIGLGIDYAIHILERYREEIAHTSEKQAIETTILRTGSALFVSGLTTVSGFAVLFLSPMPLVRNFGIITAATIVYSLIIAIFVLPSIIRVLNRTLEWYSSQTLD